LDQFIQQYDGSQFDLVILNQVFHEIDMDGTYRVDFMNQIYSLLDSNGLVLIDESIISDIFEQNRIPQLIEAFHKWQEVCVPSKFYSEKNFRKFIKSIEFKQVDLIRENDFYFWVLKK